MASSTAQSRSPAKPLWRGPLVVGLCFAIGYGITQRLLALGLPSLVQLGQGFDVRAFPGTSLESLRLRFGSQGQPVQADLEQQRQADQPPPQPQLEQPLQEQPLRPQLEQDAAPPPEPADQELPPAPQLPPPEAP